MENTVKQKLNLSEKAVHNFVEDSYNCSEAILAAFSEEKGEHPQKRAALATAFGGGIGSLGHMCGAISAGLMMIGLEGSESGAEKSEIRARAQTLYKGFEEKFGTVQCSSLTGHNCSQSAGGKFDIRNCAKYLNHVTETVQSFR